MSRLSQGHYLNTLGQKSLKLSDKSYVLAFSDVDLAIKRPSSKRHISNFKVIGPLVLEKNTVYGFYYLLVWPPCLSRGLDRLRIFVPLISGGSTYNLVTTGPVT